MKKRLLIFLLAALGSCNKSCDRTATAPLSPAANATSKGGAKTSTKAVAITKADQIEGLPANFSAEDRTADDDNYIRHMWRRRTTIGEFRYVPNPNDNVNINVGGLTNLFVATGWMLVVNEDRKWDVHCSNPGARDYIVIRCKPFTNYWQTISSYRVPANTTDMVIESFKADNEDQLWLAAVVNSDGKLEVCNGEPFFSDAGLANDSKSASFTWHQPYDFTIRVQAVD